jgi:hypothetical protein
MHPDRMLNIGHGFAHHRAACDGGCEFVRGDFAVLEDIANARHREVLGCPYRKRMARPVVRTEYSIHAGMQGEIR